MITGKGSSRSSATHARTHTQARTQNHAHLRTQSTGVKGWHHHEIVIAVVFVVIAGVAAALREGPKLPLQILVLLLRVGRQEVDVLGIPASARRLRPVMTKACDDRG